MTLLRSNILKILIVFFMIFGASWYLFPKPFYLLDSLLSGLIPPSIITPDSTIDTREELDAFIAHQLESNDVPGAAVAIIANGEMAWQKGYGYANISTQTVATPDTPFHLASISKAVMGVAVMHAIESGSLDLDADINTLLPFPVVNPNAPSKPITMRHLASHTAGIRDSTVYEQSYVSGDPTVPLGTFLQDYFSPDGKAYDAEQNFTSAAPGEEFEYSNVAAGLAGYVLEQATGTPLNLYAKTHIFEPLGMKNSGYFLSEFADQSLIAMPYIRGQTPFGHIGFPTWPDGLMRSSANDMARLLVAVMNGGIYHGDRILTPASVDMILSPLFADKTQQGLFWELIDDEFSRKFIGSALTGHSGGDPGAMTFMYFNPQSQMGTVILLNSDTGSAQQAAMNILIQILGSEGTSQMFSN